MSQNQHLQNGLSSYQSHDYLNALKQFKVTAEDDDPLPSLVNQTLSAAANVQLCNYNEAAAQLKEVKRRVEEWETQETGRGRQWECCLLKVKVLVNLMVIQLVNCELTTEETLQELLEIVQERVQEDREAGVAVLRSIVKSLFGFQSFAKLQNELTALMERINRGSKGKGNGNKQTLPSTVLLSAYSVYCHLAGKLEQAYYLQQVAYEVSKTNNHTPAIPAVLCLRHLEELAKIQGQSKASQNYRAQLSSLMSSDELEGVVQQTLFRNYRKKIDYAVHVVSQLIQKESLWCRQPLKRDPNRQAVINKLKRSRNEQNYNCINTVIDLIEKDGDVLKIMKDSDFVAEAVRQYTQKMQKFIGAIQRCRYKSNGRQFMEKLFNYVESGQSQNNSRVIDINIVGINSDVDHYSHYDSNSRDNFGLKNNLKINVVKVEGSKSNKSTFRERQEFESEERDVKGDSRVSLNPQNKNKVYLNEQSKYRSNQQEKPTLFTISKAEPRREMTNKVDRIESTSRGKKVEGGKVKPKESSVKSTFSEFMKKEIKEERVAYQDKSSKVKEELPQLPKQSERIEEVQTKKLQNANKVKEQPEPIKKPKQVEKPRMPEPKEIDEISQTKPLEVVKPQVPSEPKKEAARVQKAVPLSAINPELKPQSGSRVIGSQASRPQLQQIGKSIIKSSRDENSRYENLQNKLRKFIALCQNGQYVEKRHFSSDGGAQRFLQLSKSRDRLYWGESEEAIDAGSGSSSYLMQDIKGIVFGKVTQTMLKESNRKLQPWKCFSLILKKRTFDVYCPEQNDVLFWLPGISLCLKDLNYDRKEYRNEIFHSKLQKRKASNKVFFGERCVTRFYSVGRLLWKRCLMRLRAQFLKAGKKEKRNNYACANAYAIVVAAVRLCDYKLNHMKRSVK